MGGSKRSRPSRLQVAQITATFHPVRPSKLGIIGLGAIGGSLALQAKRAGIATVLGWSPEPAERVAAARQGAIDDAPPRAADVARAVELLVLAAPPAANLQLLVGLEPHIGAGALVTDVGSVKRAIVARADEMRIGPRFAGGHARAWLRRRAGRPVQGCDRVHHGDPKRVGGGERGLAVLGERARGASGA